MTQEAFQDPPPPSEELFRKLYRRHVQGALVRTGASLVMWLFALLAYLIDIIGPNHFLGVSLAVFYLIAINPPTLSILKRISHPRRFANFSTFINLLEILGYTAIIYSLGGIEATYLTPIYAALITYLGAMAERRHTFLVAGACAAVYTAMILLEGFGVIPWQKVNPNFDVNWPNRLIYMAVVVGLLLVVAYIASFTASVRKQNRDALRRKNYELKAQTTRLLDAEQSLRSAHEDLELRVAERTAELRQANEKLQLEIQERTVAEKSLKEAHETFLTVLDSIDATIYVADLKTHEVLFMNRHMKEAFGSDVTGSRCWEVFRGGSGPCPHCSMPKLLDDAGRPTGVQVWEGENPITGRWYINYDRAIRWIDGRKVFLQIATDITQMKKLEKDRLEAETKLHRAQKMEALGMLAGGVAHDLNNLLSGIVSYPEYLLMDLPKDSPLREPLAIVKSSGDRAAAIVQDLLNLARRNVVTPQIINLNAIVQQHLESPEHAKLKQQHPECKLTANYHPDLMNIAGSAAQLTMSFMNLVSNAFEAMPEGGNVTVSTENIYVDRSLGGFENVSEGEYVLLTVADSGLGISPEDKERIFEPFFTKKILGRSGTGLGMAVVWGVTKDHEGFIDVHSAPGRGTAFRLFFPATREALTQPASPQSTTVMRGRGESVMVVDDVEDQRIIACEILRKLGYAATAVPSGEQALVHLQDKEVDLMVIDMIMDPGMNGLETYRAVLRVHPNQKAIIASGFSETDDVRAALQLGAGAYLRKPYSIEALARTIQDVLQR